MNRWMSLMSLILIAALVLSGCSGGDADHVERIVGDSAYYTEAEIRRAMDVVTRFFEREFDGCTMTELAYDETFTERERDDGEEAIVLLASFEVDEGQTDGSLEPGGTYDRYQWVLRRTWLGGWELQSWGYA